MSTPSTLAPRRAAGSAVVPSPQPRSSTSSPLVIPSRSTSASPLRAHARRDAREVALLPECLVRIHRRSSVRVVMRSSVRPGSPSRPGRAPRSLSAMSAKACCSMTCQPSPISNGAGRSRMRHVIWSRPATSPTVASTTSKRSALPEPRAEHVGGFGSTVPLRRSRAAATPGSARRGPGSRPAAVVAGGEALEEHAGDRPACRLARGRVT